MRMAGRLQAMGHGSYRGVTRKSGKRHVWTGKVILNERVLDAPTTWRKSKMIFVNSMSDLFQDEVPIEFVRRIWETMESASWHHFQILTKRPENMLDYLSMHGFPLLENVWLGTSIESAQYLHRLDTLRQIPAAVRFISFEPLVGSVGQPNLIDIDWAIIGGESGPGARPMDVEWVDMIKAACEKSGTAFFFKQWGGVQKKRAGRIYRNQFWDEMPKLRASA
jgi:protein gp37